MNSNSKPVKVKIRQHLIDIIDFDHYRSCNDILTTYQNELGHELEQGKTHFEVFCHWCMGLPSGFDIEYRNWQLKQLLLSWGFNNPDDKYSSTEMMQFYLHLLYRELHNPVTCKIIRNAWIEYASNNITLKDKTHDINGNPIYKVHFLALDLPRFESTEKTRKAGLRKCRKGGLFSFESYNTSEDLKYILHTLHD